MAYSVAGECSSKYQTLRVALELSQPFYLWVQVFFEYYVPSLSSYFTPQPHRSQCIKGYRNVMVTSKKWVWEYRSVLDGSLSLALGWFLCLKVSSFFFCQWVSESQICRFFFLFGLQKSNYSEFMGIQFNQTELVDKKDWNKTEQYLLRGFF